MFNFNRGQLGRFALFSFVTSIALNPLNAGEPRSGGWKSRLPFKIAAKTTFAKSPADVRSRHSEPDVTGTAQVRMVNASAAEELIQATKNVTAEPAPVPPDNSKGAFSLSELQELALSHNPTLEQAAANVEVERGSYEQAGLYPNPQVGFVNGTADKSGVRQSNGAFFSQEIVTAGKLKKARDWEANEVNKVGWDLEAQQKRVQTDVKIRYYEALGAQHAVTTLLELEGLSSRGLETIKKGFANKGSSRADVLQARIQLETVRASLDEATERRRAAWQQLANIVGIPDLPMSTLDGEFTDNLPIVDAQTAWAQLLTNSPQIRSAESERDHAIAETSLARAQAIPNITVQAVADYDRVTQASTLSTLVAVPLPIYNRNQGNIYRAESDIRVACAEIERTKLVLKDLLADSLRRYETSIKQARRFQSSILPDARENVELTESAFDAGELSFLQVLVARQTYIEAELAYVDSLTELHKVTAEIEGLQLTGGLNPASIGAAIQSSTGGTTGRQRALLNQVQQNSSRQLLNAAQIAR